MAAGSFYNVFDITSHDCTNSNLYTWNSNAWNGAALAYQVQGGLPLPSKQPTVPKAAEEPSAAAWLDERVEEICCASGLRAA